MFNIPFIVDDFYPHHFIKTKLLQLIENTKSKPLDSIEEQRTCTDWNREEEYEYKNFILPYIITTVQPLFKKMNYDSFDKGSVWFQQYVKQDFHNWHRHPGTDWGFVYYCELPEDGPGTEFRNPLNPDETFTPNIKEGQFLLFPGLLEHRSKENESNNRKTVVVTNFSTY